MPTRSAAEPFEPVTMGHIRALGCRDLLIFCSSGRCYHSATLNDDWLSDETVVRSLCGRTVCTVVRHDRCRRPAGLGAARQQAAGMIRLFSLSAPTG
jgi:hypothetical protein